MRETVNVLLMYPNIMPVFVTNLLIINRNNLVEIYLSNRSLSGHMSPDVLTRRRFDRREKEVIQVITVTSNFVDTYQLTQFSESALSIQFGGFSAFYKNETNKIETLSFHW